MKSFLVLAVLASLLIAGIAAQKCPTEAVSAKIDTAKVADNEISNLVNLQFKTSYKYLLLSMNFNSYLKDRPGLRKLFRAQSDKLFDDSIALVKQLTTRGYTFVPNADSGKTFVEAITTSVSEQSSLKKGVERYTGLVKQALQICRDSDFEMKHYIEEEILEDYVKSLRKFSGYYNNLNNFGATDYKLGVFLFDEYLQKQ